MEKFLKEQIQKNIDVNEALKNCTDDFLMKNKAIILSAIDEDNMPDGYKIVLKVVGDTLEWNYAPNSTDTKKAEEIHIMSQKYAYKLPKDWEKYYLLNLNDVTWTENKRKLATECKKILSAIDSNKNIKGMWIWGFNNTGKTFASIALLNMIAKKGKKVAFVSVSELVSKTQFAINDPNKNYAIFNEKIKRADVVVLDDLGSERPTPWFKENVLLPIIDYRLKANKTTIINSNSNIEKYASKLKMRSQNPEVEEDTNRKIETRLRDLVGDNEVRIN